MDSTSRPDSLVSFARPLIFDGSLIAHFCNITLGNMITVEKTDTDLRVTIPRDAVPAKRLNELLDWLRLEEVAQRSRLTDEEADKIADKIKADWWAANKHRFIPEKEQ